LPHLPLSRRLATIRTDVELPSAPRDLVLAQPDVETLRALYKRYGFNAALKELEGGEAAPPDLPAASVPQPRAFAARDVGDAPVVAVPPELAGAGEYECIDTPERLQAWLQRLRAAPLVAFDTETSSLDPMAAALVGLSFAVEPKRAAYVPLAH